MAIEPIKSSGPNAVPANKSLAKSKGPTEIKNPSAEQVNGEDTVRITSAAKEVKNAAETGSSSPAIDEQRVAEIRNALQSGSYSINPERVAAKMLQLETQLPNTT